MGINSAARKSFTGANIAVLTQVSQKKRVVSGTWKKNYFSHVTLNDYVICSHLLVSCELTIGDGLHPTSSVISYKPGYCLKLMTHAKRMGSAVEEHWCNNSPA